MAFNDLYPKSTSVRKRLSLLSAEERRACQDIRAMYLVDVAGILDEIASETQISVSAIKGHSRAREVVRARQLAMHVLRCRGLSLEHIGAIMGRDHTTVLHGVRAEEARRQ